MQTTFKWYHWTLALLIICVCGLLTLSYGWSTFATITERHGLNGSMYSYYNLTKLQFSTYTGLISLATIYIAGCILFYLATKDRIKLTKTFWRFLFLAVLVVVCEIYLQTRFVGKG